MDLIKKRIKDLILPNITDPKLRILCIEELETPENRKFFTPGSIKILTRLPPELQPLLDPNRVELAYKVLDLLDEF